MSLFPSAAGSTNSGVDKGNGDRSHLKKKLFYKISFNF